MRTYRAAIIGCGRIGSEFDDDPKRKYVATHAGAYSRNKKIELAAISDLDESKLEKCRQRWGVASVYKDYSRMLKDEKIDILSICTPASTHCRILQDAAKYPLKAVFCEKPIAADMKEARQMVSLCKEKKIILQVDHQRRFDPLHQDLKDFIVSKKFGDVQQVNFYYTAGINNTGSHMFDLLRFFFGDAQWIEADFSKNASVRPEDPNLDGLLKFKSGVFATFQSCDVKNYLIFELNCLFEGGRIILKDSGFSLDFYKVAESSFFSGYKELRRERSPFKSAYKRNFMVRGVANLVDCIESKEESISSGMDGLKVLELIQSAALSAESGKRIFLE